LVVGKAETIGHVDLCQSDRRSSPGANEATAGSGPLVTRKSALTDGASQQVELLAALASDQGFKARRRTLLFEEAVRIFLHFEFRIPGDACIATDRSRGMAAKYPQMHGAIKLRLPSAF
jgi:hypothetical protein